ncbi:hypothetical protein LLG07_03495 [bacterium]|nr:hypothetical protein [bacterium]
MAWIDLLLLANHEPGFFYKRGIKVELKAGQLGYDTASLAKRWKWSRNKCERWFRELEKDNQIVRQKTNVTTIISIVKYNIYQSKGKANGNPNEKPKGKPKGKANEHEQEYKEGKEEIIYSNFYDSEILKSGNNENYISIVEVLFGKNNLMIPLTVLLSMPTQLSFTQFQKIWYVKEKYKINITQIFEKMQDWGNPKKRTTIYGTFQTFAKNQYPQITEWK